jgi:hypothetical protein
LRIFSQIIISFVLFAIASGCTTDDVGYRPNTTLAAKDNTYFQCKIAAAKNVPVNTVVETSPIQTTPIKTTCKDGECTTTGGETYGGGVSSYDANKGLRDQFFNRCIKEKGFSSITLPACRRKQIPEGYKPSPDELISEPGPDACYVEATENVSQIINP